MKNSLLILFFLFSVFEFGCRKESSSPVLITKNTNDASITNVKYNYKDTVTLHADSAGKSRLAINSSTPTSCIITAITYIGSGSYTISAHLDSDPGNNLVQYSLYLPDGSTVSFGPSDGLFNNSIQTQSYYNLAPGTYYIQGEYFTASGYPLSYNSKTFTIYAQPQAPSGMVCLMRYFNSTTGQHLCTTDWEELASNSQNFAFEKVLGYLSATGSPCCAAPTMKPIVRYYNHTTGGHLTTDNNSGNISGYVLEKTLGYANFSSSTTMSKALTNWHYPTLDDHFSCIPPEVPNNTSYVKDIDFTIGYIQ
jgi:hypothetical protein